MPFLLYNTLSGKKEPLPGIRGKVRGRTGSFLRLFVCGPTVYDYAHLGHARTYVFFDVLARILRKERVPLFYLQNVTDVDDKIIRRAKEENKDPRAVAKEFAKEYVRDMKMLGVTSVDAYAPATKFIPQIVHQVQTLEKKGFAYKIEGDGYYFNILKFPRYGALSRRTAEQAEDSVSRIDESVRKRNRGDFALWKLVPGVSGNKKFAVVDGEPAWNTPLGWGRPGWHIEDTAISDRYFGPQYEVHGGGLDLKFPHHEAEIAQQEAASGKTPFVRLWLHTGLLRVRGEKMSKSLNNFITLRELLKSHAPAAVRLFLLQHHYRSPMNYEDETLLNAERAYAGLMQFLAKLEALIASKKGGGESLSPLKAAGSFREALLDDINTPEALASVFALIHEANKTFWQLNIRSAKALRAFMREALETLGIEAKIPKIPPAAKRFAKEREKYRASQQFAQADELRKKIERLGYVVEDAPIGPLVWPKE